MSEHLEYRHFDVLQAGPDPDAGMLGSFIIGIPAMTFREFQNNYPGFEPEPAILRSISPEERRKIGLHLWAKRVFEKSRFCHISPTMFPHSSFKTAGANPGPRTVSLDLPGLFKHPLRAPLVFRAITYGRNCGRFQRWMSFSGAHSTTC